MSMEHTEAGVRCLRDEDLPGDVGEGCSSFSCKDRERHRTVSPAQPPEKINSIDTLI